MRWQVVKRVVLAFCSWLAGPTSCWVIQPRPCSCSAAHGSTCGLKLVQLMSYQAKPKEPLSQKASMAASHLSAARMPFKGMGNCLCTVMSYLTCRQPLPQLSSHYLHGCWRPTCCEQLSAKDKARGVRDAKRTSYLAGPLPMMAGFKLLIFVTRCAITGLPGCNTAELSPGWLATLGI